MLFNVSLKFKMVILQIHFHFLLEKCENLLHCKRFSHFSALQKILTFFPTKNNSVFDDIVGIYLTS